MVNIHFNFIISFFFYILTLDLSAGMLNDLYCGEKNCYDVLGVTRDTPRQEIAKAYRQLARVYHPDKHKSQTAKEEAEVLFKEIATAYEVLKDEDSRSDYDYMLDNPEEYYRHYYHYYKRKMSPKVDVRIVIAVTITLISVFQFYTASFRWSSGINYLAQQAKYRKMALDAAEEDGLLDGLKKMKKRNKEEIRSEEEKIIRSILENKMEIRGGYAKPKVSDVLCIQIFLLPKKIYDYIKWKVLWYYKFSFKKLEYEEEDKLYLIRKNMKLSETQFEAIPEVEKDEYLRKKLWLKYNFTEWRKATEEENKRKLAESARYKSYRRYMKKHGNGRMYFDDS